MQDPGQRMLPVYACWLFRSGIQAQPDGVQISNDHGDRQALLCHAHFQWRCDHHWGIDVELCGRRQLMADLIVLIPFYCREF